MRNGEAGCKGPLHGYDSGGFQRSPLTRVAGQELGAQRDIWTYRAVDQPPTVESEALSHCVIAPWLLGSATLGWVELVFESRLRSAV